MPAADLQLGLEIVLAYLSLDSYELPRLFSRIVTLCWWMRRAYVGEERRRRDRETTLRSHFACDGATHGRLLSHGNSINLAKTADEEKAVFGLGDALIDMAPMVFQCMHVRDARDVEIVHRVFVFIAQWSDKPTRCFLIQGPDAHKVTLCSYDSSYRTRHVARRLLVLPHVTHWGVSTSDSNQVGKVTTYDPVSKELLWVSLERIDKFFDDLVY